MERQIQWSLAQGLLLCLLLLAKGLLVGSHYLFCIEVLQLVVFWHETCENLGKCFYLRSEFQLFNQPLSVFLKLLRFDFLISIYLIDSCIQLSDLKLAFLVFQFFVFS